MLNQTITHYAPWDQTLDADRAVCGHPMTAQDVHALAPTCPACVAQLAADETALEAALDETPLPLDADEARTELDPVLNAGVPARPMSPLGAELFALAQTLNACYAVSLLHRGRR